MLAVTRAVTTKVGKFKSIGEAESWIKKEYPTIKSDFKGAHIDTINPTLEQLDKLIKEHPHAGELLRYIGTGIEKGKANLWNKESNAYAFIETKWENQQIGFNINLNPNYYGVPKHFKNCLERDIKHGWHPAGCDGFEQVITHEFGHLLRQKLIMSHSQAAIDVVSMDGTGIISDTFRIWESSNKGRSGFVSRYAKSKKGDKRISEAWADSFSSIYHGKGKKTTFQAKQEKLLSVINNPDEWISDYKWVGDIPIGPEREKAIAKIKKFRKDAGID